MQGLPPIFPASTVMRGFRPATGIPLERIPRFYCNQCNHTEGDIAMLRVGLTGGLGSGKSTVAAQLRALGAQVIEADELGRAMMEPGQAVYDEIVRQFGPEVVGPDGRLLRPRLAEMAFQGGRLDELNAIVHPAVIAAQQRWMEEIFARD